ncbi:hypothetical protein Afil01_66480 [Actinorhabdospora filicis]|uniref:Uncharacterized protein n=1 Tax=Actinorhabdospora filicis TaxID=1785913 RepID=A0A9W6SSU0_9ACTN|nr:hypothetical protein [Actinorhabdospora filicis]GLZ81841.1 hypothetical protein Afil01_66480 [Actinorhabdospora filicis]
MGSHHAPGDDRYSQDDPRTRRAREQRREPDPGSPYGRPAPEGRGGYAGAPTNPYAQQQPPQPPPQAPQAGRHGEEQPYGGGYRPQQPPAEAPRRRRRYAEEEPERAYEPAPAPPYEPARPSYDPAPSYDEAPAPVWADAPAAPPRRYESDDDRPSSWNDDQATQVYSHLGYVPREERRRRPAAPEQEAFSTEASADDKKFKSMRRARRASGKAKAFMAIGLVVALALIGGGVWYLINGSGDDGRTDTGGAYAALENPCSVLDLAAVSDLGLTEDTARHRQSSEPKSDGGAAQTCAVSLTGADGLGVDVGFDARVFDSAAKARNDWEFKMDAQKTKGGNGWKLTELGGEPGTQAYALLQSWNADAGSADYRLVFWHENVSVESRLTILKQSQVDENDLAKRAMELAKAYMAKWAA